MSVLVGSLSSNMSWDQWGRTWISTPVTERQGPCSKFVDVKEVSFVLFPEDQSNPWDKKELGEVLMELTKRMLFDMQKMWDRPA